MPQLTPPDDRLAWRASQGDKRALATIFKRYHQELYRYCAAIVGDPEDARDALQNTMVKLLAALPGERRRIQLKPWLYRVAHNEAIEIVRKRRPIEQLDPDALAGAAGPDVDAEARERLRDLVSDLGELPDRQRGALVMRELGGLEFEQIGAAFATSAAVARQTVYEARLGLQEMVRGRAMACEEIRHKLSDGDRRLVRRRDVRAHLRHCSACREFEAAIGVRRRDLAVIAPLPALAATGIVKGVLGGAFASAGGGAGAGVGGGAIAGSTAAKAVATLAVAGAIGVTAADRTHLIDVLPGSPRSSDSPAQVDSRKGSPLAPADAGGGPAATPHGSAPGREPGVDRADVAGGKVGTQANRGPEDASAAADTGTGSADDGHPGRSGGSNASPKPQAHGKGSQGVGNGKANAHGGNPHSNPHAGTGGKGSENGTKGQSASTGHVGGGKPHESKPPKAAAPPAHPQPKTSPEQGTAPQEAQPQPIEPAAPNGREDLE